MEKVLINVIAHLVDTHGMSILELIYVVAKPGIESRVKSNTITLNPLILKKITWKKSVESGNGLYEYYVGDLSTWHFEINIKVDTNHTITFCYLNDDVVIDDNEDGNSTKYIFDEFLKQERIAMMEFYSLASTDYQSALDCMDHLIYPKNLLKNW